MTVPSTARRAGPYIGNSATTSFPFGFKSFSPGDIMVVRREGANETILTYGVNYSVSLNPDQDTSPGGVVTYPISGSPMTNVASVTVLSAIPYNQQTDLPSGGNFSPTVIENTFDRIVAQIQQLAEENTRQLTLAASNGGGSVSPQLPPAQSGYLLGWNPAANGLMNYSVADFIQFGIPDRSIAAVKLILGTITGNEVANRTLSKDKIALNSLTNFEVYADADIDAAKLGFTPYLGALRTRISENLANDVLNIINVPGATLTDKLENAAAATNPGATIYIPPGTWNMTRTFVAGLNGGRRLLFDRAAIINRSWNAPDAMFLVTGDWWTIEGGYFDGRKATYNNTFASGIFVTGNDNTIIHTRQVNHKSHGLSIDGAGGGGFRNHFAFNRIALVDAVGISQYTAHDSMLCFNDIYSVGAEGITVDVETTGARIIGNTIRNCARIGAVGGIGVDKSWHNTISGNLIIGTLGGLPGICLESQVGDTFHNVISGNNINGNSGYGVWIRRRLISFPVPTGGYGQGDWNVIVGNQFQSNTLAPVRIDDLCIGNVLSGNSYDGLLPSMSATADISNRLDNGLVGFHVRNVTKRVDQTGDGTTYYIPFDDVVIDRGPCMTSPGIFTAPVGGLYQFSAAARVLDGDPQDWIAIEVQINGVTAVKNGMHATDEAIQMCSISFTYPMKAGDTARVGVRTAGGAKVADIDLDPAHTWFSGALI